VVLLDDNFPNHPKAIAAGRLARDLFVCGLCYCRKYHTDGFIPKKAISALGCGPDPKRDVEMLVRVGFWDVADGGYLVHGYQQMYADLDAKAAADEKREKRRAAGRKGGLAKASNARDLLLANASKTLAPVPSNALAHRNGSDRIGSVDLHLGEKTEEGEAPPLDVWLAQLQDDYPQNRVTYGHMTEQGFVDAFQKDPRPARVVWAEMRSNLENQKAGHEWRVKGMAPKLETWLRDGRWKQRHEVDPPAVSTRQVPAASDPWWWASCPHTPKCGSFRDCGDLLRGEARS